MTTKYDYIDPTKELTHIQKLIIELSDHLLKITEDFMKINFDNTNKEITGEMLDTLFNGAFDYVGIILVRIADFLEDKGIEQLKINSISALNNHLALISRNERLN